MPSMGVEPTASRLRGKRSSRLSYEGKRLTKNSGVLFPDVSTVEIFCALFSGLQTHFHELSARQSLYN